MKPLPVLASGSDAGPGPGPSSGDGVGSGAGRVDLLRLPVLGPFLRWKHARTVLQSFMLVVAALVVADGLFGPDLAPRNLAGTLPWVHWRGLVVVALLLVGNLFCMACPFMLVRRVGRWIMPGDRPWPAALRNKWLAVALLFAFFWAYEAFDLWESPWLTAWIILAYFAGALVIDGVFRGASFCKYVCPIGQFNFLNSLLSPTEVRIRDPEVCASCRTKDCIGGRWEGDEKVQSGCELWLFQERKVGNQDCTFCMECIQACPWDNVGIGTRLPGAELTVDPWRSGVGRFTERPDLMALAVVLTFAAFMNAFGMVSPVYQLQGWLGGVLGTRSEPLVTGILFVVGLGLLPPLAVGGAALLTRRLAREEGSLVEIASRYAWSLVPTGFGMWLSHYLFHFLLGGLALVPLLTERLVRAGILVGASPPWATGTVLPESWLLPVQLLLLEGGMLVSVVVAHRIARRVHGPGPGARRATLPWALLAVLLSLLGMWLLTQPMEMRGTALG